MQESDNANQPARTFEAKIRALQANSSASEFILADAKDADMAFGLAAPGHDPDGSLRTLHDYRARIRENTEQGLIDIMLMSASTADLLVRQEHLFDGSAVTPAFRGNDASDIWCVAGSQYCQQPSRPFRTADLQHTIGRRSETEFEGADLALYSMTFNNDVELDRATLTAYRQFRAEAASVGLRHFLEVFDPNAPVVPIDDVGRFVSDNIARALAGVAGDGRPMFLKIAYHGPAAMERLVQYDSSLVVGILGGAAGTTYDAFHQLWEARKYGARAALYGRMINQAEHQPTLIEHLRLLADGDLSDPREAVRSYHSRIENLGIVPARALDDDLVATR